MEVLSARAWEDLHACMSMKHLSVARLIAEAQSRVEGLSPTDLAAALDGETLLVDVREPHEREAEGAIAGSILVARGVIESWADPESPSHVPDFDRLRRIIIYCDTGHRSALAADVLRGVGYRRVGYLEGGLQAWIDGGRGVEVVPDTQLENQRPAADGGVDTEPNRT